MAKLRPSSSGGVSTSKPLTDAARRKFSIWSLGKAISMSCVTRPTYPCRQTAQRRPQPTRSRRQEHLIECLHHAAIAARQILRFEHSIPPSQQEICQLKLLRQCFGR